MKKPSRVTPFLLTTGLLLAGVLAARAEGASGAGDEPYVVPLSDPSRPARLEVGLMQGSVFVVAGRAGEVVVEVLTVDKRGSKPDVEAKPGRQPRPVPSPPEPPGSGSDDRERRRGLRRVPNPGVGLEIQERDNRVEVSSAWGSVVSLRIQVPPSSAVELSTINEGDLEVTGLSGALALHNTNGSIRVRDVTGPVDASTLNGEIEAVFGASLAREAMAFSTLNGDIDLTLPADAGVDVVLRSDNGEILTDFDVELRADPKERVGKREDGVYRVSLGRALSGRIGSGGPELFLKTFNGDILLRRATR